MNDKKAPITMLQAARLRRGWSLLDVAGRTGITPGDVSMVERVLAIAP